MVCVLKNSVGVFIVAVCLIILGGCVEPQVRPAGDAELWEGALSGGLNGKMTLKLWSGDSEGGQSQPVSGTFKFSGNVTSVGFVTGKLKVEGEIKDGILNAALRGTVMSGGESFHLRGTMIGTMSKSQGLGTWKMSADAENVTGEWSVEKRL